MTLVTFTSNYSTNLSETSAFEKTNSSSQNEHNYPGKEKDEDGEIGVFGAEKYFNGAIHDVGGGDPRTTKKDPNNMECTKHEGLDQEPMKPLMHHGAPSSVHSQSSWNSQNPLLHRNPPMVKPNKAVNAKSFLSCLGSFTCYCFDRNSIDIEVGEISFKRPASNGEIVQLQAGKPNKTSAIKEDLFTFPTMDSTVSIRPIKVPSQGEVDEIGRKSLEVFGSPVLGIGRRNKSLNLERRLKMLPWDHSIPKVLEETENSKGINSNDTESDASSDLFEIESLTEKPSHGYAPSEASIEWSVFTASAADYEEGRRSTMTLPSPIKTFPTIIDDIDRTKKINKPRSGGLLGCNSSKAVKVAVDAHKTNQKAGNLDPRMRRVSDSYMPETRFRVETKIATGAFEPTRTPRILATRSLPLPHSHSPPQASHILYI